VKGLSHTFSRVKKIPWKRGCSVDFADVKYDIYKASARDGRGESSRR